jgi:hypothetical protein
MLEGVGLHEFVLAPGDLVLLAKLRIDLHQRDLIAVEGGIACE